MLCTRNSMKEEEEEGGELKEERSTEFSSLHPSVSLSLSGSRSLPFLPKSFSSLRCLPFFLDTVKSAKVGFGREGKRKSCHPSKNS